MLFLRNNRKNRDSGTTYAEVLVALAILSLMALGTYRYIRYTSEAGELLHHTIRRNISIFTAQKLIRKTVEEVSLPYWAESDLGTFNNNTISIPYFDARPDSQLVIEIKEETLSVQTENFKQTVEFPLSDLSLQPLSDPSGDLLIGALLIVESTRNDFKISIPFYWGGIPCK